MAKRLGNTPLFLVLVLFFSFLWVFSLYFSMLCFILGGFHFKEGDSHKGIASQLLKWSVTCLIYPSCCFCRPTDRCQTHKAELACWVGLYWEGKAFISIGSFASSAHEINPKAVNQIEEISISWIEAAGYEEGGNGAGYFRIDMKLPPPCNGKSVCP